MTTFHPVDLYGGAIKVSLPTAFADVSAIRQVPDNQEVYLDRNGFTSIVFDILERVENISSSSSARFEISGGGNSGSETQNPDVEALKYHLSDIVDVSDKDGDAGAVTKVWTTNQATLSKLPPNTTSYTLLATSNPNTTPNNPSTSTTSPAKYSDFTAILLTLVRLVDQKTDIAISINVPHLHGDYDVSVIDMQAGRYGGLIERAMRYREEILRTFEVMEWGLFVDG